MFGSMGQALTNLISKFDIIRDLVNGLLRMFGATTMIEADGKLRDLRRNAQGAIQETIINPTTGKPDTELIIARNHKEINHEQIETSH
jgi:hypothetical protein